MGKMLNKRYDGAEQTIVGTNSRIKGDIRFVGVALIDGHVNGSVMAGKDENATLIIKKTRTCRLPSNSRSPI